MHTPVSLGTALRHLIDLLDGDVMAFHQAQLPRYRPRYTPVVRALLAAGRPVTVRYVAERAGITHSAASQTISQMKREGWLVAHDGGNGRERMVAIAPPLTAALPELERRWRAINAAAAALDKELSAPLSRTVEEAIAALGRTSFRQRIAEAADDAA